MRFTLHVRIAAHTFGSIPLALPVAALMLAAAVGLAQARPPAQSGGEGEALFKEKCVACHTIGGGAPVGPDLAGVTTRRSQEWLTSWILAPDQMLAQNDPLAVQLLQENKNVPMPNYALSEAQAASLIAYLETQAGVTPSAQPAAAAPVGDPAIGKALFTGADRFQNGGPPCMGCHSIAGIGALGGGALGPDLTPAYTKYGGDAGLASFLATTPTQTMSAVWARQPLTAEEQANLMAFIKQASVSGRSVEALGQLAALALAGTAILLFVAQIYWRRRLVAVRRPLVAQSRIISS